MSRVTLVGVYVDGRTRRYVAVGHASMTDRRVVDALRSRLDRYSSPAGASDLVVDAYAGYELSLDGIGLTISLREPITDSLARTLDSLVKTTFSIVWPLELGAELHMLSDLISGS